jgi:hypothetical protein
VGAMTVCGKMKPTDTAAISFSEINVVLQGDMKTTLDNQVSVIFLIFYSI